MYSRVLIADPRAYGCRAWGGCTPGDRCAEHRDSDPASLADLIVLALDHLAPPRPVYGRPRLRVIRGGRL
jgi:hypothetical protein